MTSTETTGFNPAKLAVIRGLLAKAEATPFPEEAKALSDKAQELLSKYNIDARVLDAAKGTDRTAVDVRLITVGKGYQKQQLQLAFRIADALGVFTVTTWSEEAMKKRRDIFEPNPSRDAIKLYGTEASNELVELLFTSLVLQAANALKALTIEDVPAVIKRRTRTQAAALRRFRTGWYYGWADGVGDRLKEAHGRAVKEAAAEGAVGAELVLVSDLQRFEARAKEDFGTITKSSATYSLAAAGAGRTDSKNADIGLSRVGGKRTAIGG